MNILWQEYKNGEKQKLYDIIRADVGDAIDEDADDFTKLAQIIYYFLRIGKFEYVSGDGKIHDEIEYWEMHDGICAVLAHNFMNLCLTYGINCDIMMATPNAKYDSSYLGYL